MDSDDRRALSATEIVKRNHPGLRPPGLQIGAQFPSSSRPLFDAHGRDAEGLGDDAVAQAGR